MAGGYLSELAAGTMLLGSPFAMTALGPPLLSLTHPLVGQRLAL